MMKKIILCFLFLCQFQSLLAQKEIKGTVSDDVGMLMGVSVMVAGTEVGAETDEKGAYTITAKKGDFLEFSYIGNKTVKVQVKDSNKINVTMKSEQNVLNTVVVTGITKTDKRLFTGAAVKLKAEDITLEGIPDISRSLEGRASGVTVQNVSGTFGSAPRIRIRGATSIFGSSKPLWVVDGVVMDDVVNVSSDDLASGDANTLISSAVAGLNPDDIESFDILKDGSATSIYGARAMAGVIVITTKKGRKGHSKISYGSSYTYRKIPDYKDFNIMNSQQEMSVYQELESKGLFPASSLLNGSKSGVYGNMYKQLYSLDKNGDFKLKNTDLNKANYLKKAEYRNTDWFKKLFNVNTLQTHSLSFSSGTDKAQFYGSLSALVDPGWMKQSDVNRYTGNFNASFDIYDNLKLNVISNNSLRNQKAPGTVGRETDAVTGKVKRDFDINPYSFALNTSRTLDSNEYYTRNYAPFNVLEELDENFIDLNVMNMKFQTELSLKVNSHLSVSALTALKYNSSIQEHNITEFSNQANAYRAMGSSTIRDANPFLYTDPDDQYALPISILPKGGFLKSRSNKMFGYDFRTTASYKNLFADRHTVNTYLGAELNSIDRESSRNTKYGVQFGDAKTPFVDYRLFKKAAEENNYYYKMGSSKDRAVAFFGNVTYSLDRKYTINGTLRYEGSNRLGKSRTARWLPTWNVSGAWNASDEEFFGKLKPTVSNLTFKGSYSLTADRGPRSVSNSLVDIRSGNPWRPTSGQKETSIYISDLENSQLTYEKKNEINFGVEAGFLKNRLNATFDWYKRDNYDLIGPVYTQGMGGQVVKYGNVASMKSGGVELSLSSTNIKTENFSWTTSFVYSKMHNEITELESRKRVLDLITGNGFGMEGYPVRTIFSVPFKGLNSDGLPTFLNEKGNVTVSDVYLQNRDKVDFLEYSGSADPTDVGSFGNTFKYKGLELNVFTTYSFGNVVRLEPNFRSSYNDFSSLHGELVDRWVVPGDETKTTIPAIPDPRTITRVGSSEVATAFNLYNYSSERVAKGDFVRLKQVSLGYDFPKQVLDNLKVSRMGMKLQATNLMLFYSDKKLRGQDPEFMNSGGVAAPVPTQITLTLNLSI